VEIVTNDPIPRRTMAIANGWLSMHPQKGGVGAFSLQKMRAVVKDAYDRQHEDDIKAEGLAKPLSEREVLIMQLSALGFSNREIANVAGISDQTVKNHKTAVFRKLRLDPRNADTMKAVRRLHSLGLIRFP
jgi:DNA-binding NarL/FixJ family response regulator